jgi:hypothetical protein
VIGVVAHTDKLRARLRALRADVERGAAQVVEQVATDARDSARGTTKFKGGADVRSTINVIPAGLRAIVRSDDRRIQWLDQGTGLFGPRAQRIVPTKAKVLRFVANGAVVFARSVKGIKPMLFMKDAREFGLRRFAERAHEMFRSAIASFRR